MTSDRLALGEMQSIRSGDRVIIRIPLFDVAVPRGEMSRQKAEGRITIVESDRDRSLVPAHSSKSSLKFEISPAQSAR